MSKAALLRVPGPEGQGSMGRKGKAAGDKSEGGEMKRQRIGER